MRGGVVTIACSALLVACSDASFDVAGASDNDGGTDSAAASDTADAGAPLDGGADATVDATIDGADTIATPDALDDATAADARDLCRGIGGLPITADRIVNDPDPVKMGAPFTLYVVSQKTLPNLTLNIGGGYCAGGGGFSAVAAGPDCKDYFAAKVVVPTGVKPLDKAGVFSLEVFVDDPDAPCTAPFNRKITGTITVAP